MFILATWLEIGLVGPGHRDRCCSSSRDEGSSDLLRGLGALAVGVRGGGIAQGEENPRWQNCRVGGNGTFLELQGPI